MGKKKKNQTQQSLDKGGQLEMGCVCAKHIRLWFMGRPQERT